MNHYSMKEKLKITAGAIVALIIVGWLVALAIAFLSVPYHSTATLQRASPAVGAGTRIGLAIGRAKSGRSGLFQTVRDPIAEGWARRRLIALARRGV
jgi:hypothetical protein